MTTRMMNRWFWIWGFCTMCGFPPNAAAQEIRIQQGDLTVLFRDNSRSPQILSGVQSLLHASSKDFDAFDPDSPGASAGLNFEHIISGHRSVSNKFTPRRGRYALRQLPLKGSVELVRRHTDSPWAVSSTLRYTVSAPHAIDFEFRCRAHEPERFGTRGYALFFFANYMNDVADAALHFLGVDAPGGEEKWIAADAPAGHPDWNSGGTYRHRDARDLEYDEDLQFRLNSWSYDFPRFTHPFYYGKAANGMVYILMFDRASSAVDQIRFSLFKFKLKRFPRPAWDFQYVINHVEKDRDYGFKGRVVWKKFVSPEDCRQEYESWRRKLAKM
jgi:hypothetical protein